MGTEFVTLRGTQDAEAGSTADATETTRAALSMGPLECCWSRMLSTDGETGEGDDPYTGGEE